VVLRGAGWVGQCVRVLGRVRTTEVRWKVLEVLVMNAVEHLPKPI
jgi:hypothetical protein